MADLIPRDLGSPFDPSDPEQMAAFEGFASDVPTTEGMIDYASGVPVSRANALRARQLFSPAFLTRQGVAGVNDLLTPDAITPSVLTPVAAFERKGMSEGPLLNVPGAPGGGQVFIWSFDGEVNRGQRVDIRDVWPAPTIRVREGEIVHTLMGNRSGPHTIHHHGIEPTPVNDGTGHLTFEVTGGNYTYQWRAGEAGTYFYHCHRNTVLHFEMGMYGMLIVDPDAVHPVAGRAPFADGGPGMALLRDVPTPYDVEAIWVADDIEARWHSTLGAAGRVAAGIQAIDADARSGFMTIGNPQNPRLHDFNASYFVVSGRAAPAADNGVNLIAAAGATVPLGGRLLVRAVNASYCNQVWRFPTTLPGTVIAQDARTLGRHGFGSYSEPFALSAIGHQFSLTTARRWDLLIEATLPGTHQVEIEFRHHITNLPLRTVRVPITVVTG